MGLKSFVFFMTFNCGLFLRLNFSKEIFQHIEKDTFYKPIEQKIRFINLTKDLYNFIENQTKNNH